VHEKLLVFVQTKLCLLSLLKTDKNNDFSCEITNLMSLPPDFAVPGMIYPLIFRHLRAEMASSGQNFSVSAPEQRASSGMTGTICSQQFAYQTTGPYQTTGKRKNPAG